MPFVVSRPARHMLHTATGARRESRNRDRAQGLYCRGPGLRLPVPAQQGLSASTLIMGLPTPLQFWSMQSPSSPTSPGPADGVVIQTGSRRRGSRGCECRVPGCTEDLPPGYNKV